MAGKVVELNDANFEAEVLQSDLPVLVDFWAAWCGPCKALAPTVEALAEELAGKAKICKLDIDSSPNTAGQYSIRSIPTLLIFKGGENIGQLVGNVSKQAIEELIAQA